LKFDIESLKLQIALFPIAGGYTVECDSVLVDGTAVVNESMLTGESIPVTKVFFPPEKNPHQRRHLPSSFSSNQVEVPDEPDVKFNYDHQRQYIIFCGTEVRTTPCKPVTLQNYTINRGFRWLFLKCKLKQPL
jgi:cation-transporting ATPase 13A3/4/5